MAAYVKVAVRLVILCVLVIGVVMVSEPPSALANACCDGCAQGLGNCLHQCFGNLHCDNNCENEYALCLKGCGTCQ